jgi:hypothetical protein
MTCSANLLPIIPTSFQQFSEKQCGKQQGTIEARQQSRVFLRFALEKVRGFAYCKKIALTEISATIFWQLKLFFFECIASRLVKLYYQRSAIHLNCSTELTIRNT